MTRNLWCYGISKFDTNPGLNFKREISFGLARRNVAATEVAAYGWRFVSKFNENIHSTSTNLFTFNKNIHSTSTNLFTFNKNIYSTSKKFIHIQQKYLFNFKKIVHI